MQFASFLRFLDPTQLDTHLVGLLCDELIVEVATYTTNTRDERPCPQQDSNPQSNIRAASDVCFRLHGHSVYYLSTLIFDKMCLVLATCSINEKQVMKYVPCNAFLSRIDVFFEAMV